MRKILFIVAVFATFCFSTQAQTITPISAIQYISPANLATGNDLSAKNGDTLWIKGVCTFNPCNYSQSGASGYPNRLATFLMDTAGGAWNGIEVMLDPAAVGMGTDKDSVNALDNYVGFISNFQQGFLVKCQGIVKDFSGNSQFSLIKTPSVLVGPVNIPSPKVVTIDTFEKLNNTTSLQDIQMTSGEKYEGTYVQINNPIITNVNPSYSVSGLNGGTRYRYDIKDGAGNTMTVQDNFSGVFCNTKYDMYCTGNNSANPVSNTPTVYTGYSNGSVITYIRGFIGQYLNTNTGVKYYTIAPLQMSDIGTQTFAPPVISNLKINPGNPTPTQSVTVTADVVDDSSVASVQCFYVQGLSSHSWTALTMNLTSGTTYKATIPATVTDSVYVKYYIKAVDNFGHTSYYPDTMATNSYYLSIQRTINKISDIQGRAFSNGKSIYVTDTLKNINITGVVMATQQSDDLGLVTIQDGTNKFSGIALSDGAVANLHRGEKINITSAVVNEVNGTSLNSPSGMTTLSNPTYTIVSTNNKLYQPITNLNMDTIHANRSFYAEPYEAMLIGFKNIVVADTNPDYVAPPATYSNFGEWAVDTTVTAFGVRCDDLSNDIPSNFNTDSLHVGQSLCYINGVLQYAHSNWKILPRNRTDICSFHTDYSKRINSFSINTATGSIVQTTNPATIAVAMPAGTTVTALTPALTFLGAFVSPSPNLPQDFTNPVTYTVYAPDSSSKAYVVTVSVASGINNINNLEGMQLYPNPSQNMVHVILPQNIVDSKTIVSIKSLTGVQLAAYEFENKTDCAISISNLASGLYFLEAENGNSKKVMKMSVVH